MTEFVKLGDCFLNPDQIRAVKKSGADEVLIEFANGDERILSIDWDEACKALFNAEEVAWEKFKKRKL